jgi:O6-methylguanine-DNA--protein-cysteine methyltransferase
VEEIAFSIGESALGAVLIARSADGVCTILIGSEAAELEGDLATQFVDSKLVRNDRKLSDDLRKILRFIEMPSEGLELPLDIRGTPFQQRVWDELLRIPPGSIVTYGALANRIGEPPAGTAGRRKERLCRTRPDRAAAPPPGKTADDGGDQGHQGNNGRPRNRDIGGHHQHTTRP